jgi:hypothetical protein
VTGVETFKALAPELLRAHVDGDPQLLALVRKALIGLQHYDLPLGVKIVPDPLFPSTCWVMAVAGELKPPNAWLKSPWQQSHLSKQWERRFRTAVTKTEGVASWEGLELLGRRPVCHDRMHIQVVRLVPSVRNFIRDDDNTSFATKQFSDALKRVGLIKEDRREWYTAAPLLQDVSPIAVPASDRKGRPTTAGVAVVLFILRPTTVAGLLPGVPDADRSQYAPAHREETHVARRTEAGRTDAGRRRRPRARAVDV